MTRLSLKIASSIPLLSPDIFLTRLFAISHAQSWLSNCRYLVLCFLQTHPALFDRNDKMCREVNKTFCSTLSVFKRYVLFYASGNITLLNFDEH
jgi:hypothetical protein